MNGDCSSENLYTHSCESPNKVVDINVWLLCIHIGSDL